MHKNIGRSWLGTYLWYLSTQTRIHAREYRPLLVRLKPMIFIDSDTHTCTRISAAPGWAQTLIFFDSNIHTCTRTSGAPGWAHSNNIYRLIHAYMDDIIGRSRMGSKPWYLSTQTHIHARQHRSFLVGLKSLIFIDSNTHTCTRTSTATRWVQTPKIYQLKHAYMHENIGRSWLGSNPWYLSTYTHIHVRKHRPLLIGLKPMIFIHSNTQTCTRPSFVPRWAQTPHMYRLKNTYMHENIGRSWLGSNPYFLSTQTQTHAREHRSLLVGLKTPEIYRHKNTYMHVNIGRSWLGSNPWYVSTQTHTHVENISRSWLGSNPDIYRHIHTYMYMHENIGRPWLGPTSDIYRLIHTYMHENIGRSLFGTNPWPSGFQSSKCSNDV